MSTSVGGPPAEARAWKISTQTPLARSATSLKAGRGTNETIQGGRTELAAKRDEQKIQGLKGEQGDSDTETLTTKEAEETARRELKEVYHKYRKLSDAVLESEDIPLGHRQTIRRYFEAIRPSRDDAETGRDK